MRRTGLAVLLAAAGVLLAASPAPAADILVPADAGGVMESYRGQPWYTALTNCTAFYMVEAEKAGGRGDAAAVDRDQTTAAGFFTLAADRLSRDRGVSRNEAMTFAGESLTGLRMGIIMSVPDEGAATAWRGACDQIKAAYGKAFG